MPDTPDPDLRHRLEEAIKNLPKKQRDVFLAHCMRGLSYDEIADSTPMEVRKVERQLAKAIYKLAKQLDGRKLTLWERWF
jgi:RNA polymerase sigma-70 factor (ECF subfamily)